jgi:hypothetical protein
MSHYIEISPSCEILHAATGFSNKVYLFTQGRGRKGGELTREKVQNSSLSRS